MLFERRVRNFYYYFLTINLWIIYKGDNKRELEYDIRVNNALQAHSLPQVFTNSFFTNYYHLFFFLPIKFCYKSYQESKVDRDDLVM